MATGQAKPGEDVKIYQQIGESVTAMLQIGALLRVYVPVTLLLVEVAAGRMDGFWQFGQVRVGLLAGALMVEEAGGTVSDARGAPWTTASEDFLATAPGIHKAATNVLSKIA
jgi:myo-inositol-1(or 4)-monophosphatase